MRRPSIDQRIVVASVFVAGMLMSSIDSTVVNVALATLSRQFNVKVGSIDAIVVGYLVSLAVVIPASGWLGDRFGTRRIFLLALLLFTGASALCGAAQSFGQLVLFRVLQGAGGGMLTPVGQAMLYRTFPPHERVQVARVLMFPRILGPASGPVIGGLLINELSWRWAFYVNVPVGLTTFLFSLVFLHEHREPEAGRFDFPGFLLAGAGFALLMFALSDGPTRGWSSPGIIGTGLSGLAILAVFVLVELRTAYPMVQLHVLSDRLFNTTTLVNTFATAGFQGILFMVPLFLQEARGASALSSGLTTFPEALGVVVSTQLVARLYPRVGPRRLMSAGLVWVAVAMTLLTMIHLGSSSWLVRGLMFLIGMGMAYVFLPSQAAGFATISRAQTGQASTLFNVQRQIGAALGVAALSTVLAFVGPFQTVAGSRQPHLAAYDAAFIAAAGFAVLASVFALRVPDRDAAVTMVRQPSRAERASAASRSDAGASSGS